MRKHFCDVCGEPAKYRLHIKLYGYNSETQKTSYIGIIVVPKDLCEKHLKSVKETLEQEVNKVYKQVNKNEE